MALPLGGTSGPGSYPDTSQVRRIAMIESASNWGRKTAERVRGRSESIAGEMRKRIIEPTGEGLRAGADAVASRVKRVDGESRLNAATLTAAGFAGALGEYFLDPESGRRRRAVAKDRIVAFFRRRKAEAERETRYAAGVVKGAVHEVTPSGSEPEPLNDPALAAKVESEIFRDRDAPKGEVNVSVEDGVVYIRGELESRDRIEELAASARAVKGVGGVVNLLHLPGEEHPSGGNGHRQGKAERQAAIRSK